MNPIFILASERSGTNLLRSVLGAHSEIAAPQPAHMWTHLINNLPYYGDLSNSTNFKKLVSDAIKMINVDKSHLKWKYDIKENEVLDNIRSKTVSGVISTIYNLFAKKEGANYWVSKEVNLFDNAFRILNTLPDSKFIYLIRDGRDVACSVKKVPTLEHHIYFIARQWREEQLKCLKVYQDLINLNKVSMIRYEDFISNPEKETKILCDYLDLNFEPEMLGFFRTEASISDAKSNEKYWGNLSKPIKSNNKGKFLKELSNTELRTFETITKDMLSTFGYPLFTDAKIKFNRIDILKYKIKNKKGKKRHALNLNKEEGWKKRKEMLKSIYQIQYSMPKPFKNIISKDDY